MSRRHMPTPGYTSAAVGSSVIKMTNVSYGISSKLGAQRRSKLPVRNTTLTSLASGPMSQSYGQKSSILPIEPGDRPTVKQGGNQPFTLASQRPPTKFAKRARQIVHMPLIRAVAGAGSVIVVPKSVAASMIQKHRKKSLEFVDPSAPSILVNDQPLLTRFGRFKKTANTISTLVNHPLFKPTFFKERAKHGKFKSLARSICQTMRVIHSGFTSQRLIGSNARAIKSGRYPLLKREILERLFEYMTVEELKCARLVCEFWSRFASVCLQKKSVVRLSGNCDICKSEYMSTDETIESHEHIETISFYRFVLFILEVPQEKRYALPYRNFRIRKLNLYFISGLNTEPTRVFLMFLKIYADKIHHFHLHAVHMCPPDSFYRVLDSCTRLQSVTFDSSNFWLDPLAPTPNQPFIMRVNYYLTSITFASDWICEELLHWQMIFNAFPKLQELNLFDMSRTEINHCLSILLNLPDEEEEEELRTAGGFKTLSKKLMFQPFFPNAEFNQIRSEQKESSDLTHALAFKKVTRLSISMPFRESRLERLEQLRDANLNKVTDSKKFKATALSLFNQPFGLFSKKERIAAQQIIAKMSFQRLAKNLVHQPFSITLKSPSVDVEEPPVEEQTVVSSLPPSFKTLKGIAGIFNQKTSKAKVKSVLPKIKPEQPDVLQPPTVVAADDSDSMSDASSVTSLDGVARMKGLALLGKAMASKAKRVATTGENVESVESPPPPAREGSVASLKDAQGTPPTPTSRKMKGMADKVNQKPFKSRGVVGASEVNEKAQPVDQSTPVGTPGKNRKSMKGVAGKVSDQPFKARGMLIESDTTETEVEGGGVRSPEISTKSLKGVAGKVGEQPFKARGMVTRTGTETKPPAETPAQPKVTTQKSKMLKKMLDAGKKPGKLTDAFLQKKDQSPQKQPQPPVSPTSDSGFKNKTRSILNQPFTLVSPAPDMAEETFRAKPFKTLKKSALNLVNQPFKLTGMEKNLIDRFKSTVKTIKNQPFNLSGVANPQEFVLPGSRLTSISVGLRRKFEDHLKLKLPHVPGETEESEQDDDSDDSDEDEDEDETKGMSPVDESDFNDLEINELLTEVVSRFPITKLTLRVHYTKEDAENFPIVLEACRDKIQSLTLTRHLKFYFPAKNLEFRSNPFEETEGIRMKFPLVTRLSIVHNLIENIDEITHSFPALTHLTVIVMPTEFCVRQMKPYKTYVRTNLMFSMKFGVPNPTVKNLTWSIMETRNPVTQKRTIVYKSNAIRHVPRIFPNLSKLSISITAAWELHTIFRYCTQLHDFIVLKNSFYRTKDADIIGVEQQPLDQDEQQQNEQTNQFLPNYGIKQLKFLRRLSLQNNNCNLSNLSVQQGFIHLRRLRSLHISRGARIGVKALRVLKRCRFLVHVHVTKEKLKPRRQQKEEMAIDDAELEELGLQKIPGYPGFYISLVKQEEEQSKHPTAKFEASTKYDKLGGKKYDVVRTTYVVNGRTYVLVRKQYEYEGERDKQIWATRFRLAEFRKYHEAQQKAVETALAAAEEEGLLDPAKIIRDAELRRQRELQNEESDYERFLNDYDEEEEEEEDYEDDDDLIVAEQKNQALQFLAAAIANADHEESSDEDGICMEADTMYEADKEFYPDTTDGKSSSENESYCDSVDTQQYQGDKEMGDLSDDQIKKTTTTTITIPQEPVTEVTEETMTTTTTSSSTTSSSSSSSSSKSDETDSSTEKTVESTPMEQVDEVKVKQVTIVDKVKSKEKSKKDKSKKLEKSDQNKIDDLSRAETDKIIADALMCNETVGVEYAALKAFQAKRFSQLIQVTTTSSSSSSDTVSVDSFNKSELTEKMSKHKKDKSKKSKYEEDENKHERHRQRRLSKDEDKSEGGKCHRHHHHHHRHHHEKKEGSRSKSKGGSKSRERSNVGSNEVTVDGDLRQALIQKMVKNVRRELRK